MLEYISIFSIVPAALLATFYLGKALQTSTRILTWLALYKILFEAVSLLTGLYAINNMPWLYLYTLGEIFFILAWFYHLPYFRVWRWLLYVSAILLFSLLAFDVYAHWGHFIRLAKSSESICLALLSCMQVSLWFRSPQFHGLSRSPDIYAGMGFFVYFGINTIVFNYYGKYDTETSHVLWTAHQLFNTLSNLLLFIAIFVSYGKRKISA